MDRMLGELEGKPGLPSETQPPSPPPEGPGDVSGAEVEPRLPSKPGALTEGCERESLPVWVQRRAPLEGIGGPAASREEAEAQARVEVVKQLEVSITGDDTFTQQETTGGDFSYSVRSTVIERVNVSLSGLEIRVVFFDTCHTQHYAWAKLDRGKAENAWRADLRALDSQADAFRTQITTHEQKGEAFPLVLAHYRLMAVQETASQLQRRLAYLTGKPESGPSRAGDVKQSLNNYESVLDSLQVKTFGGGQQAVGGPQLPDPLVVQVLAGEVPVPRVPVQFTVRQGQIEVPHTAWTDVQGKAQVVARYSMETEAPAHIEAQVLLDQVTHEYPDALKNQVHKRREQLTARFDVLPPVYHLRDQQAQLVSTGETLRTKIQASQAQGAVFVMMDHLSQLHTIQMEGDEIMERLRQLHPPSVEGSTDLGDPEDTAREFQALATSLELRSIKGSGQQAVLERPLEESLQAQLVARVSGAEVPVAKVPVLFEFEKGQGEVDPHGSTNGEGYAQAIVHRVDPVGTEAVIVARLHVTELGQSLSAPFQEQLRYHLRNQVLRFRMTPPRGCVSASPFDGPLYEMACDLVRQVNSSVGKATVVRGFIERNSRERYPLSDRIEEALRAGLTLTHQLQVLGLSGATDTQGSVNGEVEVSGVYERFRGGLLVKASLTRLSDRATEAASEATIPRDALPAGGLPSAPHTALPLLPNQHDFTTHDEWVTAFWQHHNPEASFRTWIKPEEAAYREQENATFLFKTERDCYLWAFNIGASGSGAVLLPNKFTESPQRTLVRASDGWVSIPGPADPFRFPISPPFGIERVKTICTTRPVSIIPFNVIQSLSDTMPLFLFSRGNHRFRDLGVAPSETVLLRPGEWSEAHTKVVTLPAHQQETRGLRGLRSRGLVLEKQ